MSESFSWPPVSDLSRVVLVILLDLPLRLRPQLIKPLAKEIRRVMRSQVVAFHTFTHSLLGRYALLKCGQVSL